MNETNDYNSIRGLAYVLPTLFLIMTFRVATAAMTVMPKAGLAGMSLFRAGSGFSLACQLMEYVLAMISFVFLYRLAEADVWLDVSNTMFLCYMLTGVLFRIVEWVGYRLDPDGTTKIGLLLAGEVPILFVMLGTTFVVTGMARIYKRIRENSEKIVRHLRMTGLLWFAGCLMLVLAEHLLGMFILRGGDTEATAIRGISVGLAVFFLVSSVPYTLRLRKFCFEYYMYCYNRGR